MISFRSTHAVVAVAAALLAAGPVAAQMMDRAPTGPVTGTADLPNKRPLPPPGLPGAAASGSDPAPMDRPPSDMRPNEALFDAINRGDIASARDALSRGAELNARNILGLTPIELSVDLGRNDITFLLLSMRNDDSPQPAAKPGANSLAAMMARQPMPKGKVAPAPKPVVVAPVPAKRYVSNDPGTPQPQAGFLGFGNAVR